MNDCPNCGTQVEADATQCRHCGTAISAQGEEGGAADESNAPERRRPPEGMQPPEGITGGDRADQQKIGPFTRRQLLLGAGGAVAVGGAWYLFGGGSAGRDPEAVLRAYVQAVSDGDPDGASTTVHQSSPAADELIGEASGGGSLVPRDGEVSLTVDSVRELSREQAPSTEGVESFVTFEATITISGGGDGESQVETVTIEITLAQNPGGLWKLWTFEGRQLTS